MSKVVQLSTEEVCNTVGALLPPPQLKGKKMKKSDKVYCNTSFHQDTSLFTRNSLAYAYVCSVLIGWLSSVGQVVGCYVWWFRHGQVNKERSITARLVD